MRRASEGSDAEGTDPVDGGRTHQLPVVGRGARVVRGRNHGFGRLYLEIEERGQELGARRAIHRRVVHLGDERDAVVLEALDDPDLPQRLAALELHARDVAHDVGQLAQRAGRRHADPFDVAVDVEVRVVDPHRVVQPQRHIDDPLAERSHQMHAIGDVSPHGLERVATGHRRGVEDGGQRHMRVHRRRLDVQEEGIEPRETLHVILSLLASWPGPQPAQSAPGVGPAPEQVRS